MEIENKKSANSEDLDIIANFMDSILKKMKERIKNPDTKMTLQSKENVESTYKKQQYTNTANQKKASTHSKQEHNKQNQRATQSKTEKPPSKSISITNLNRPLIITKVANSFNRAQSEQKNYRKNGSKSTSRGTTPSSAQKKSRSKPGSKSQKTRSKGLTKPQISFEHKLKTNNAKTQTPTSQHGKSQKNFTVVPPDNIKVLNDRKQNKSNPFLRPTNTIKDNIKKIQYEMKKPIVPIPKSITQLSNQKIVLNKKSVHNSKPVQNQKLIPNQKPIQIQKPTQNQKFEENYKIEKKQTLPFEKNQHVQTEKTTQIKNTAVPVLVGNKPIKIEVNKTAVLPQQPIPQETSQVPKENYLKKEEITNVPPPVQPKPVASQMYTNVNQQAKINEFPLRPTDSKKGYLTPMEIIQDYVNLVNKAKRDKKTFTICGNYFSLRRAFAERGWLEKVRVNVMDDKDNWKKIEGLSNLELVEGIRDKEHGEKYRRAFISKLLAGHQVDFYWDYLTNPFTINNDKVKRTLINRFPYGGTRSYTSKAGLCNSLKDSHWYYIQGYSNILFPRTYNLANEEEIKFFIDDFRQTAAISLLQFVIQNANNTSRIVAEDGKIATSIFNFATLQVQNFMKHREHKDIDETVNEAKDYEWDLFLEKFYSLLHQEHRFKENQRIAVETMIEQSRYFVNKLRKYFPELNIDGVMNLWLLKPHNGSRGCGILVCRTLKYILDVVQMKKEYKYVVQKYIERPFLIHNTKFDIRQWFLVSNMPQLTVWMYKDCYLRFSSQTFNLNKLHESIHLTNNSVQCRYKNCQRSNDLPDQNMWHSDTFKKYLDDIGQSFAWRNIIYKGMKESLIGLFMLCQDKLTTRINSFELCGADFMVAENFKPYLIEINSRPALHPSTKITGRMCPKVLEDVIKVTVDFARNPKASTGNFELIYRDSLAPVGNNADNLSVEGIAYSKYAQFDVLKVENDEEPLTNISSPVEPPKSSDTISKVLNIEPNKVKKDVKNTLEKILSVIHSEQNKRIDQNSSEEKTKNFRNMLTEFVDIISNVKNEVEAK